MLLSPRRYQNNLRTVLVGGLVTQVIEHHEAMLLLIRNNKNGSAFALARSIFEGLFRGTWFQVCATDTQLQDFEKNDELPAGINMTTIATAIDAATTHDPQDPNDHFTDLRKRGWPHLCSYAHSGMLQLARRFTGEKAEPCYKDDEIIEITTSSTTCVLLLVATFLGGQNLFTESHAAAALIGTYGVTSP
ncbi:MAG: DUF6988 family protein [Terriglobales bacterium]